MFDRDPLSSCTLGRSMIEPERITSGDFLQSEASYNLVLPHATDGARTEPQRTAKAKSQRCKIGDQRSAAFI